MAKILVTGVAVIDFVFQMDEFPDRPEKYRTHEAVISGGGCAANAAVAIARLGGEAMLSSRLGADAVGDMIVQDIKNEGVDCNLVKRFQGARSSFSSVYLNRAGERQIMNFRDPELSMSGEWLARLIPDDLDAILADTRWPQGAVVAMEAAKKAGIPGIMDAEAPVDDAREALKLASHVAFSAQGLADYSGSSDPKQGLETVAKEIGGWLCFTNGEFGVEILSANKSDHIPAFPVEAVDTLGAGDVWHGAFALKLAEDAAEEEAILFANAAAAIKCTQLGGRLGTPDRNAVEEFMKGYEICS
ncbi:MAG: PfkB family carbohydrate kinase [Pseudomonadota bacterium]